MSGFSCGSGFTFNNNDPRDRPDQYIENHRQIEDLFMFLCRFNCKSGKFCFKGNWELWQLFTIECDKNGFSFFANEWFSSDGFRRNLSVVVEIKKKGKEFQDNIALF